MNLDWVIQFVEFVTTYAIFLSAQIHQRHDDAQNQPAVHVGQITAHLTYSDTGDLFLVFHTGLSDFAVNWLDFRCLKDEFSENWPVKPQVYPRWCQSDPPENCHLNVKKLQKLDLFLKKIAIGNFFFKYVKFLAIF